MNLIPYFSLTLFLLPIGAAVAQPVASPLTSGPLENFIPSIFNEIYAGPDSVAEITIETDLKKLRGSRHDKEYLSARIFYQRRDGTTVARNCKVRPRGHARRELCRFTPLKIDFKKSDLSREGLQPIDGLKLVNQCRPDADCAGYIFREFLAYRLYNLLTPYSYRVQLATVNYVNTGKDEKGYRLCGILIEPEKEFAARMNGSPANIKQVKPSLISPGLLQQMAVFQYMIGNTDWSVANLHNFDLFSIPGVDKLVPVPYDFDYSGLVNTDYARPHSSLPIKTVRERYFKGTPPAAGEIETLCAAFREYVKSAIVYCEQSPYLDERQKKDAKEYLAEFYEILDNKENARKHFLNLK